MRKRQASGRDRAESTWVEDLCRAAGSWHRPNLLRHQRVMVLAAKGQVDQCVKGSGISLSRVKLQFSRCLYKQQLVPIAASPGTDKS